MKHFTDFANTQQAKYLWSAVVVLAWIYLVLSWRFSAREDEVLKALPICSPAFIVWSLLGMSINKMLRNFSGDMATLDILTTLERKEHLGIKEHKIYGRERVYST